MATKKESNESKKPRKTASAAKGSKAKTTSKKAPASKEAPKKKSASPKTIKRKITAEEHYQMVQTAAYFRAQRDGFKGDSMKYWIEAEKEIKALLDK